MTTPDRIITATLVFDTALHVGVGRDEAGMDAPLRRDEVGAIVLPGTAIAGVLRAQATRLAPRLDLAGADPCVALQAEGSPSGVRAASRPPCDCVVCRLFGDRVPTDVPGGVSARASALWVFDAKLHPSTPTYVRDRVGIDRASRSAARASRVKNDIEIVPAGARFAVRMQLDATGEEEEILLAATLGEWAAGRAWLGSNSARGLGHATLQDLASHRPALDTPAAVLAWLRDEDRRSGARPDPQWYTAHREQAHACLRTEIEAPEWISARIELSFDSYFLSHDPVAAAMLGVDLAPLADGIPGSETSLAPVLTGSSIRGALRSRAERIARTLVSSTSEDSADFLRRCPACAPNADEHSALTRCDRRLVSDKDRDEAAPDIEHEQLCLACRLFGSTAWGSRLRISDARLDGESSWRLLDYLAVDRFTGGALRTAKFDAVALTRPTFVFDVHFEQPEPWELGWLAWLMRDLHEGLVDFGYGRSKAFGRARATSCSVRIGLTGDGCWETDLSAHVVAKPLGLFQEAALDAADLQTHLPMIDGWITRTLAVLEQHSSAPSAPGNPPLRDSMPDPLRSLYSVNGGGHVT